MHNKGMVLSTAEKKYDPYQNAVAEKLMGY
jgi:hypothetical protein